MQAQVNVSGVQTCVPGHVPAQTGNGALPQAGSRLVDVVVATAVLVVLARLVDVVPPAMVVDVVQAGMGDTIWLSPGSPTAPGPGRSPAPSTVGLKVGGMQKTLTSVEECAAPSIMIPAGTPVSEMLVAVPWWNAPWSRCSHEA